MKEKSNNLNDKVTNLISPAVKGYYNLSDKIGEKVYGSENFIVKAVRGKMDVMFRLFVGICTGVE